MSNPLGAEEHFIKIKNTDYGNGWTSSKQSDPKMILQAKYVMV